MNRLWVRISLTFIAIVLFLLAGPITIGISTGAFETYFPEQIERARENRTAGEEVPAYDSTFPESPAAGFLRFLAVTTLLGMAVGVVSSRGLSAPLNRLAETAKQIGDKDLSRRVEIRGTEEVQAVAIAFNDMAEKLEQAEALRSSLLADIAHELRTPLTVIQGNLRAILDDVYQLDKTEIAGLYDQTRHLSRLVNDLHELALAEANQLQLDMSDVELGELILQQTELYRPFMDEKGIQLEMQTPVEPIHVLGDRTRLAQSLQNLIRNAIPHTPAGGNIEVRLTSDEVSAFISVNDSGSGIPPEHLPYVFDRFYRADPARTRDSGGSGLGLAITRALVEGHGGTIDVESDVGAGTRFRIVLPLRPTLNNQ